MLDVPWICGIARPYPGETECGDAYFVADGSEGTLIALADGLGHGPQAASASRAFCEHVGRNVDDPLDELIESASRALQSTRGVAASLVRISRGGGVLSYSGVGNIDLQASSREPVRPVSLPGIVGRKIRKTKTFQYKIHPGDLFALHSDGISSRFELQRSRHLSTQQVAAHILETHGKQTDDASVVVFRIE